jgi:Ca2+-binding EF-hand superfamily protein
VVCLACVNTDESGLIDEHELRQLLFKMGLDENEAPALLLQYGNAAEGIEGDPNAPTSKEVSIDSFLVMMAQVQRSKAHLWEDASFDKAELSIFRDVFNAIDVDGSGSIDAQELGSAAGIVGIGNLSQDDIRTIISVFDEDHNGTIEVVTRTYIATA